MGKTAQGSALSGAMRTAWACLLAVALAVGCGLGTGLTAWAADDDEETTTYTITVNNASSGNYSVYNIVEGAFGSDNTISVTSVNSTISSYVLSALSATSNDTYDFSVTVSEDGTTITYKSGFAASGSTVTISYTEVAFATAVSDAIATIGNADLEYTFAENLANAILDADTVPVADATATLDEAGSVSLSVSATGYYLVVQTSTGDDEAITTALLARVTSSGYTVNAKQSTPTADKSVVLDSDTGSALTIADDGSATITYQVTGTVASNIDQYDIYYYAFVDTMPAGISTEDASAADVKWSISVNGTDVSSSFTATGATDSEGTSTLTWECADLTAISGVSTSDLVEYGLVLTYTVTLSAEELAEYLYAGTDSTATSGTTLTNSVYVVFSNDPYTSSTGVIGEGDEDDPTNPDPTGTSTTVTGTIYLYTLTVNKVDENGNALSGATFTLTAENGYSITGTELSDGIYIFAGIEKGVTYTLSEVAPTGYKAVEDITFTIAAETDEYNGTVTYKLDVTDASGAVTTSKLDNDSLSISLTIANVTGASLPVTGAQGILLGLIIGGALVLVSAVTLLRRRKGTAE